eukprot:TRINITY_DN9433_c0_g1_i1.p2 TRINITY_DN9433_c0_g1~~TRINITY_DN9433_c0_g1_i1.p2  ORF type:complete len:204 (-),score=68.51 TRINITY_DN9433_c0_g1_i1:82-693(-)
MPKTKEEEKYDPSLEQFTIVVLGGPAVGKSALTLRMITENFVREYDPTIEDIYTKKVTVDGIDCVLKIVDTAGNDDFSVLVDGWINQGDGFLLVFSIVEQKGFRILESRRAKILKVKESSTPPMLLVGSKCDLESQRVISREEAKTMARDWNLEYMETSAKERINDEEVFFKIIRELRRRKGSNKSVSKEGLCKNCNVLCHMP